MKGAYIDGGVQMRKTTRISLHKRIKLSPRLGHSQHVGLEGVSRVRCSYATKTSVREKGRCCVHGRRRERESCLEQKVHRPYAVFGIISTKFPRFTSRCCFPHFPENISSSDAKLIDRMRDMMSAHRRKDVFFMRGGDEGGREEEGENGSE
ncbi:hypothetical protein PENSPDRAFT_167127 [Peniophora sp. CONT]|nr:hypothetical protein PENSPDRAFT_167127 [Peniophora sp. CONT]